MKGIAAGHGRWGHFWTMRGELIVTAVGGGGDEFVLHISPHLHVVVAEKANGGEATKS